VIKATPNYPLCISARPGPSWCVRGLFWKRDKLTSAKIFADVCSRMRGVIPASPSGKFSVGCLFPHARGDPSLTPGKIFPRVLHPFFRLQPLHLLQSPGPVEPLGHIVPAFARFTPRKIFLGPGGKALCGENRGKRTCNTGEKGLQLWGKTSCKKQ